MIGSGPAGLSCAGELARRGHSVTVFEKRELAGGLSTYGIIALREPVEASLAEVGNDRSASACKIETGAELGRNLTSPISEHASTPSFSASAWAQHLRSEFPAKSCIVDGLDYIEQSKLNRAGMRIGRNVVVIGAGNTAIDCATVAKRLGADQRHHDLSPHRTRDDRLSARVRVHQDRKASTSAS